VERISICNIPIQKVGEQKFKTLKLDERYKPKLHNRRETAASVELVEYLMKRLVAMFSFFLGR